MGNRAPLGSMGESSYAVEYLLKSGADPTSTANDGRTAAELARDKPRVLVNYKVGMMNHERMIWVLERAAQGED